MDDKSTILDEIIQQVVQVSLNLRWTDSMERTNADEEQEEWVFRRS